jgi:hypothetical protein
MDRIGSLLDRPKQYYNIDGVGELGVGFMLLGFSLIVWMQVHAPEHSVWNQMYTLFLYVGLMVAIIHYGSKAIKTHITYPRTGFVEYRTRDRIGIPLLVSRALPADLVGALAKGSWITPRFPARLVGAVQLTITFYGTVFLISGGMSFWLYLHHTQAPAREPQ